MKNIWGLAIRMKCMLATVIYTVIIDMLPKRMLRVPLLSFVLLSYIKLPLT